MKVFICSFKSHIVAIPPIILGVSETFLGAIDLCITAAPLFISPFSSEALDQIKLSEAFSDEQKQKFVFKFEKQNQN
jgi:hypothetical protein